MYLPECGITLYQDRDFNGEQSSVSQSDMCAVNNLCTYQNVVLLYIRIEILILCSIFQIYSSYRPQQQFHLNKYFTFKSQAIKLDYEL